MLNGRRVTLALRFGLPEDDPLSVVQDLLKRLHLRAIQITCLFLDKGFNRMAILRFLTPSQQPALIACTIRGKQGGTRALCTRPKSYRTQYTFESAEQGAFTAELAVCRAFTPAKRTKRLKRRVEWLIYILIHVDLTPRQARRKYRRRFGIDRSYRCAGQVRGWTTSPNAAYRFGLLALSFILLNVWLCLRWLFCPMPRRGRRWLNQYLRQNSFASVERNPFSARKRVSGEDIVNVKRFQLTRFAKFIRRALEHHYGTVSEMVAVVAPQL